jgi:hypothetical protein
MKQLLLPIFVLACVFCTQTSFTNSEAPQSRGKQKKIFPKTLNKHKIYLGMTEEKFLKKITLANKDVSKETITYTHTLNEGIIASISYFFTTETVPRLYQITLKYKDLNSVIPESIRLLGNPNHKNEWRFKKSLMKEDFDIGVWTFGHKLVYAATLKKGAWEQGF